MSINALTNDALKISGEFQAAAARAVTTTDEAERAKRGEIEEVTQDNAVTTALDYLIKFIPTELVTLYFLIVSASLAISRVLPSIFTNVRLYVLFAVLTPIFLLLVYMGKRKTAGLPAWPPFNELPLWKMVAATLAFLAWALAVPGNGLLEGEVGGPLAGVVAVLASVIISVLDPIFRRDTTG